MERESCLCDSLRQMRIDGYLWQDRPGGSGTGKGLIKTLQITNENIDFNCVNQYPIGYMIRDYENLIYCTFCGRKIVW